MDQFYFIKMMCCSDFHDELFSTKLAFNLHQGQLSLIYTKEVISFFCFYYPPRDVFALNTGKYRPGCIFFVYTGALVLWIMSVNNFQFFNNISESM